VTRGREHLANLLGALRTTAGHRSLVQMAAYYGWPVLAPLAALDRRTRLARTRVVCVVGSHGKTTTRRAIAGALGLTEPDAPPGNGRGQVPLALLRTPRGQRHVVLEIGIAGPGEMHRFPPVLRPDVAVVTGIGTEHSRSLGTLETTRREKSEMVRALAPGAVAVLNGDDPNVRWMAGQTRARTVTYGLGADVDVRATDVTLDWPHGTRFRLRSRAGDHDVRVRLIGTPGVHAALAAIAVALAEEYPLDRALPALEAVAPTPGRLQPVALPGGAYLLRDEVKSPAETIEAALDVLGTIPAARRLVILGEVTEPLGPQGPIYRGLGTQLARIATRVVLVGSTVVHAYRAGARAAGMPAARLVHVGPSVHRAAAAIAADLGPGDVVLLKGRDVQRLDRVGLILCGRTVRCERVECHLRLVRCGDCALL
jgi:UDP-N-acetylmuramoyl-tripeptide--D-alanyl-D-alanine ligase